MVFDKMENLFNYTGLLPQLCEVKGQIEALFSAPEKITLGRHDLSENVYVNVAEYEQGLKSESHFEMHKHHADIQIMLVGQELLYSADASFMDSPVGEYSSENDCAFFDGKAQTRCRLCAGYFAILLPNDYHIPSVKPNENAENTLVRKAVIKISL